MSHAVVARLRTCGVAFATFISVLALALAGAGPASAASPCNAGSPSNDGEINGAALEACVTEANASTEPFRIALSSGNFFPTHTLRLSSTHGITIEGPSTFPGAKLEGTLLEATAPEMVSVGTGDSATLKSVQETTAGSASNAAIETNGSLTIENSTIAGNNGAQVLVTPSGSLTATNSTIGAGLATFGLVVTGGTASLTNDTVANNEAGNIENKGTLNLHNTIIAEPEGSAAANCTGAAASTNVHSLSSDGTCGTSLLSTNPHISALLFNNGPTTVYSPQPTSAAIDAVPKAECPTTDQRGQARPDEVAEANCDIGAVESNQTAPVIHVPAEVTAEATSSAGVAVTLVPPVTAESTANKIHEINCTPGSGSKFKPGITVTSCTAVDGFGNTASGGFNVNVTRRVAELFEFQGIPFNVFEQFGLSWESKVERATPLTYTIPKNGGTFSFGSVAVNGATVGQHAHVTLNSKAAFEETSPGKFKSTGQGVESNVKAFNTKFGLVFAHVGVACTPPPSVTIAEIPVVATPSATTKLYTTSFTDECLLEPFGEKKTANVEVQATGPEQTGNGHEINMTGASFKITAPEAWRNELVTVGANEVMGKTKSAAAAQVTLGP
jgi:hypothetical protein